MGLGSIGANRISVGMNDISMTDCYAAAYYLYSISELLLEDAENELNYSQVQLFFKLVDRLNKRESLSKFLNECIHEAEEDGFLHCLEADDAKKAEKSNEETDDYSLSRVKRIHFDNSDIPYKYEEDNRVDRNIPNDGIKIDSCVINLYRCIYVYAEECHFFSRLVANFLLRKTLSEECSLLEKIPSHIQKALNDTSRVSFLSEALNLTENECRFLLFSYRCVIMRPLMCLVGELSGDAKNKFRINALGIPANDYNALLRPSGALRSFGFIDEDGDIMNETIDCITTKSMDVFFADLIKEADCSNAYKLSTFNVNRTSSKIMQKMLSSSENISLLLYGKPGSGKTEFAKSLAKASGLKPIIFKNEAELDRSTRNASGDHVICRLNLLLSISRPDTVLIIDEADTILQTRDIGFFGMTMPSKTKGTVNKMLEKCRNKIIWIVNFTSQIDDSTLRRFNFSYKFDAMSREQLRSITTTKLKPLNLPSTTNLEILNLMEKYSITGASVDNVVKTIKSLGASVKGEASSQEGQNLVGCVKTILKENSLLINGKTKMRESVGKNYDSRALNATMDPEKIVQMIKNAQSFAEENQRGANSRENGIRMLFYGVSGTGKTEFARYIAEKLGKKILLKRASDILDKYVGGSEQNIRNAFEEAERSGSILLFDEADSFFADRSEAQYSWERTQVNEFLTQMEEFGGIVICTTNLKNIMDSAMNRRFHMIVEFKPLKAEGIRCMLDRYFHSFTFSDDQIDRLERRCSVTPGDFGVLASRMRFMDKAELDSSYIIKELCIMQDEKDGKCSSNHKIGFVA